MPIGYGSQCKACNSARREEIDRRLLAGSSVRDVASWLAGLGESIGKSGLARHQAEHLNVLDEARARLSGSEAKRVRAAVSKKRGKGPTQAKERAAFDAAAGMRRSEPLFEDEVERVVADALLLDEIASLAIRVARKLEPEMRDPTQAQSMAFADALRHARGAVTDKHELLHGKRVNVEGVADEVRRFVVELSSPDRPVADMTTQPATAAAM